MAFNVSILKAVCTAEIARWTEAVVPGRHIIHSTTVAIFFFEITIIALQVLEGYILALSDWNLLVDPLICFVIETIILHEPKLIDMSTHRLHVHSILNKKKSVAAIGAPRGQVSQTLRIL